MVHNGDLTLIATSLFPDADEVDDYSIEPMQQASNGALVLVQPPDPHHANGHGAPIATKPPPKSLSTLQ